MRWLIPLILTGYAVGTPILVSASGTFSNAPTSVFSAPDTTWSLSFIVDSNPANDPGFIAAGSVFDPPFSDFTYTLGGTPVSVTIGRIVFETGSNSIFTVCFFDANCIGQLSFFGPTLPFSGTVLNPTILPGVYPTEEVGVQSTFGMFFLEPNTTVTFSAVPEPNTFTLSILGLGIFALARYGLKLAMEVRARSRSVSSLPA